MQRRHLFRVLVSYKYYSLYVLHLSMGLCSNLRSDLIICVRIISGFDINFSDKQDGLTVSSIICDCSRIQKQR